jgi:hypothetical protein
MDPPATSWLRNTTSAGIIETIDPRGVTPSMSAGPISPTQFGKAIHHQIEYDGGHLWKDAARHLTRRHYDYPTTPTDIASETNPRQYDQLPI